MVTPATPAPPENPKAIASQTQSTTPIKPGWKTSEFWLSLAAKLLSVGFVSGVIPTSGTAATIAGVAAVELGALGYAVVRASVKKASL